MESIERVRHHRRVRPRPPRPARGRGRHRRHRHLLRNDSRARRHRAACRPHEPALPGCCEPRSTPRRVRLRDRRPVRRLAPRARHSDEPGDHHDRPPQARPARVGPGCVHRAVVRATPRARRRVGPWIPPSSRRYGRPVSPLAGGDTGGSIAVRQCSAQRSVLGGRIRTRTVPATEQRSRYRSR